jgi:hypothetical protein
MARLEELPVARHKFVVTARRLVKVRTGFDSWTVEGSAHPGLVITLGNLTVAGSASGRVGVFIARNRGRMARAACRKKKSKDQARKPSAG